MNRIRYSLFLFLAAFCSVSAMAADFQPPTPEELKMTSDPAAPNAPAVYLFRQETVDDKIHIHTLYVRIKVLTEKGKEYGDVEIPPYEGKDFSIRALQGRTIHSDGTIIPFTGKPIEKLLYKQGDQRVMTKVFSLPDVQVGSIIEYRYDLAYDDHLFSSPRWYIQQPIYVHKAHYHFVASNREMISKSEHGNVVSRLLFSQLLPPGMQVREGLDGFDLTVENIPGLPDEEYMPPMQDLSYRVLFYYTGYRSGDDFWADQGKTWSKGVERFAHPSPKLQAAVQQLVAPTDTQEQKAHKIYNAVMQLENTRFTRQHSAEENKAEGLRIKTADDIWDQKRGSDDEITRLYIAMVRSAGLKAYDMIVADRSHGLMLKGYMNWGQLDDEIAIVQIDGKEIYLDPGQRYCEFGKLQWIHTMTSGVRQIEGATAIANTPVPGYKETQINRYATLKLDSEGKLSGIMTFNYSGNAALHWRQRILRVDADQAKKDFEDALQKDMPAGVVVKTNHFVGSTDFENALVVMVDVSGSMGTATGKRVFLPGTVFEANAKPLFIHEKRESPVDLHFPYIEQDQVSITLPEGYTIESAPKDAEIKLPQFAEYVAKYKNTDTKYQAGRLFVMANVFYQTKEYPDLKNFYAKANAQDQEQVVLHTAAAAKGQ